MLIGVVGPQLSSQAISAGLPSLDQNNLIYVPPVHGFLRLEETMSWLKDENR